MWAITHLSGRREGNAVGNRENSPSVLPGVLRHRNVMTAVKLVLVLSALVLSGLDVIAAGKLFAVSWIFPALLTAGILPWAGVIAFGLTPSGRQWIQNKCGALIRLSLLLLGVSAICLATAWIAGFGYAAFSQAIVLLWIGGLAVYLSGLSWFAARMTRLDDAVWLPGHSSGTQLI